MSKLPELKTDLEKKGIFADTLHGLDKEGRKFVRRVKVAPFGSWHAFQTLILPMRRQQRREGQ